MLSKIKNSLKELKQTKKFKDWEENHLSSYLTSVFFVDDLQFGFYNPERDTMTSFKIEKEKINIVEEEKIFRKEKSKLKELKLEEIKFDFEAAIKVIEKLIGEKYKGEEKQKAIVILQVLENPTWNITYLTKGFNILNVKINAISGKILEEKIQSAISFKQN